MQVKILPIPEIYNEATMQMVSLIKSKPNAILGLATGGTSVGLYNALVKAYKENKVSFKQIKTFNLDEYYPIDIDNPQSYRYFMNNHLFNNVDIDKNSTFFPSIDNYQTYDQMIDSNGGIDIQILGLGSNGHIAFNEPGTSFDSLTHIVQLADSTIKDNARFFNNDVSLVPTKAISMGLKSIMKAKKIILIATGKNKAKAIKQLLEGDININLPVSVLKNHSDVTIYLDKEAASLLC